MKNNDRCIIIPMLLAASLFLLPLAGCGSGGGADRELVVVHQGWPLTFIPHRLPEIITLSVQSNIFEGLVEYDPSLKVVPLLAENWETPDELTWVFPLRQK